MPRAEAARYGNCEGAAALCRFLEHLCRLSVAHARPHVAAAVTAVAFLAAAVEAFAPAAAPALRSKVAMSKMAPQMSMEYSVVEQVSTTLAGVVAVDGGTVGLDVSFAAFLAVILGLFILFIFIGIGIFSDGENPFAAVVNAGLTLSAGLGERPHRSIFVASLCLVAFH